jgi:hypothetical protein
VFDSQDGQNFVLLRNLQTDSGVDLASYPVDTGGGFPGE